MEIASINGISVRGRDMAFCREVLSSGLQVILEVVSDTAIDSDTTPLEDVMEEKGDVAEESLASNSRFEQESFEADQDSIIFGENFVCAHSLGSIEADMFVDIGHLLRINKR